MVAAAAAAFELAAWKRAEKAAKERGRKERAEGKEKDRGVGEEEHRVVVLEAVGSISFGELTVET